MNDAVQKRVQLLRDEHHIIVTQADEDNIKKTLIVELLRADDSRASVRDKVDAAIIRYEVNDVAAQRDIYIQYASGGGAGARPPE